MSWAGRKVAVTGGAGFVGSHLVRALVRRGAHVTVVDNLSTGRESNLADVAGEIAFLRASTLETHRVARALRGCDTLFHLAAVLGVKRTWEEPVRVVHDNVVGTHQVLHAAADAGVERVVLASSSEVYGDGAPPYHEERTPAAPLTGYAAAKLAEEKLAQGFSQETGMRTACLRYFNIYGPGQEASAYGFVTAIFCSRVLAGERPVVFGDGQQTRDFTFVDDAVEGTLLAADHAGAGEVFNLGTGRETRVDELARAVARAAGRDELAPVFAPPRADEVRRRVADAAKAREVLGWQPRVGLLEGLRATLGALQAAPRRVSQ